MNTITNNPGIYAIYNTISGKKYIGSSLTPNLRVAGHFAKLRANRHQNTDLQQAYNENSEIFEIELLEECDKEHLEIREQFYIDTLSSLYNIIKIAVRPLLDFTHSEKSKLKMSVSKKELYQQGFEVWNKGLSPTQETRDKISNTLTGKYTGEKSGRYGKANSEEAKKLMVAASHRRKGTHHTGQNGRVFKLDKVTGEVLNVYSSAIAAASTLDIKGTTNTAGAKIGESIKYKRNAYGFKWEFENNLDQIKVDELLESLKNRSISSQAEGTSSEGSETT